jgi:hypothetical protein
MHALSAAQSWEPYTSRIEDRKKGKESRSEKEVEKRGVKWSLFGSRFIRTEKDEHRRINEP